MFRKCMIYLKNKYIRKNKYREYKKCCFKNINLYTIHIINTQINFFAY